jgi:triosephosphate isomerase
MQAKPLIVASHKLFLGLPDAVGFAQRLLAALDHRRLALEIVMSPSLINLAHVAEALNGSPVAVAAQNVHQEGNGAFTGQVSLEELRALRVQYVVIGHSEVVAHQHDRAETLSNKIRWCVRHGVRPMVCVTDDASEDEHASVRTAMALRQLFASSLCDELPAAVPLIVYEPSSAASCDSPEGRLRVRRALHRIREETSALLRPWTTVRPRVLYGGGVNPANVRALVRDLEADGFMVGRASVDLASFLSIVDAAQEALAPVEDAAILMPAPLTTAAARWS